MSLHAVNPETMLKLRKQRMRSTVASLIIGVLVVGLMMLALAMILLSSFFQEIPMIVAYQGGKPTEEQVTQPEKTSVARSKPSAPSSAMSRVIAADCVAPTAIPVPDIDVEVVSEGFGTGDDFGDGWRGGGGDGFGGGGTSFFQQKVRARRIAYVIDYSLSMRAQGRESLMRDELRKSVEKLSVGIQYQLIFFAGPTWVAGDQVAMVKGRKAAVVKSGNRSYDWVSGGKAHDWKQQGAKQQPEWIAVTASERKKSIKQIQETKLIWGTDWEPALESAMSMDPPPQIIFFMTDGVTGGDVVSLVRKLGAKAKAKGIVINTVAMMEPKAEKAMKELAKRTGGQFSIVHKGGKVEVVPAQ